MNEVPAKVTKRQLPSIQELYSEDGLDVREKDNDLNVLLNREPLAAWIKPPNKFVKNSYLPIERVEWLLTKIFIDWYPEIMGAPVLIGNSVAVVVRLHYWHPNNEWRWLDGVGAVPLQTDAEKGAIEFNFLKSDAVKMAAPAALSYAIKDAASRLGKIFGRDLARKDSLDYESNAQTFNTPERDLKTATKKIIDGLDAYAGDDRDTLKEMCVAKQKSGELTMAILQNVAEKIGLVL